MRSLHRSTHFLQTSLSTLQNVLNYLLSKICLKVSANSCRNAGYCFVEFSSPEAATKALGLTGTPIQGTQNKHYKLNWASGGGLVDRRYVIFLFTHPFNPFFNINLISSPTVTTAAPSSPSLLATSAPRLPSTFWCHCSRLDSLRASPRRS